MELKNIRYRIITALLILACIGCVAWLLIQPSFEAAVALLGTLVALFSN